MNLMDPIAWAIVLIVIGCALVVLEVFIPSGGLISFLATLALLGGLVMAFRHDAATGLGFLVLTVIAVPTVVGLAFKYWPRTPMGKAFLGELAHEGDLVPDDPRRDLVGRVGIAKSKMLPSGAIQIDGKMIDAISQGMAIEPEQAVVVVEVKGNRVMVRLADEEETSRAAVVSDDLLSKPIDELGLESLEDPLG
jgi:membrane-bound serine protease (ClpP class)